MAIAFDLDGTLAHYEGWQGTEHIGEPVEAMVNLLKGHIANGEECIIFTARVSEPGDDANNAHHAIAKWLRLHNLPHLEVTATKLKKFKLFYDDRCVRIACNQGRRI